MKNLDSNNNNNNNETKNYQGRKSKREGYLGRGRNQLEQGRVGKSNQIRGEHDQNMLYTPLKRS